MLFPYPTDDNMLTSYQRDCKGRTQSFLIAKEISCIDEERKTYRLTKWVKDNEYNLFPTVHPDFLDALFRIYDMDAMSARSNNRGRSLDPPREARY